MENGEITLNPKTKSVENTFLGESLIVQLRGGRADDVIVNLLMTRRANFFLPPVLVRFCVLVNQGSETGQQGSS